MDKINVSLFGGKSIFGGKETPLEAHIIYCDKYENCSFYKNGKCLNQRTFLAPRCKFGRIQTEKGYTSRARKYYNFKSKYTNDTAYNKLNYPQNEVIGIVEDKILLKVPHLSVDYIDGEYKFSSYGSSGLCSFNKNDFNIDMLYRICTHKPRAMMGGTISDYANEQIPELLQQIKKVLPNLHAEFIKEYPNYDLEPNYVGKWAYINSMVIGSNLKDSRGNTFILDEEFLICESWNNAFIPFDGKAAYMKIKITDKMKYKITKNEQCDENTVFE